jgi:hypothetical protein
MDNNKEKTNKQLATFLLMRKYISRPARDEYESDDRALTKKDRELIAKMDEQTHLIHRLSKGN